MTQNKVELLGYYGGDETHALSAWTSTNRDLTPDKAGRIDKMLKMLAENGHHTPFEKSYLHFLVTCETATHIQLLKHRVGVSINAESARYKELKEDRFYVPRDWPEELVNVYKNHIDKAYINYHAAIELLTSRYGFSRKRAKESARFLLPYANQVTMDVSFNFRSFMHFINLRGHANSQQEIQDVADKMLCLVTGTNQFNGSLAGFGWLK